MGTFNSFEEIPVWQKARLLVQNIYRITGKPIFKNDYGLREQIQRAGVSIMANIAEGFELNNKREFIRFLKYSKASCGELRSHLYVAFDNHYITEKEFTDLKNQAIRLSQEISGFIKYLKSLS